MVFVILFLALIVPLKTEASIWNPLDNLLDAIITAIVQISNFLVGWILYIILTPLGIFAGWLLDPTLIPIINSDVVTTGYKITLDLANMFFVLIIIVIAFATIFRIKSYGAESLLPNLIITAVLINFSKVIAGVVIDFSNVLTSFFLERISSNSSGVSASIANALKAAALFPTNLPSGTGSSLAGWLNVLGGIIVTWIFALVTIAVFASFVVLLFSRVFALWMLLIGAPLAWLFRILPKTQKYWNDWWEKLISWSFVAPVFSFFLYLALKTNQTMKDALGNPLTDNTGAGAELSKTNPMLEPTFLLNYIVLIGLLLYGVKTSKKMADYMPQALSAGWQSAKGGFKKAAGIKSLQERAKEFGGKVGEKTSQIASRLPGAGLVLPKAGEIRTARKIEKGAKKTGEQAKQEMDVIKKRARGAVLTKEEQKIADNPQYLAKTEQTALEKQARGAVMTPEEQKTAARLDAAYATSDLDFGRNVIEQKAKNIAQRSTIGQRLKIRAKSVIRPSGILTPTPTADEAALLLATSHKTYKKEFEKRKKINQWPYSEGQKTAKEKALESLEEYFKPPPTSP